MGEILQTFVVKSKTKAGKSRAEAAALEGLRVRGGSADERATLDVSSKLCKRKQAKIFTIFRIFSHVVPIENRCQR